MLEDKAIAFIGAGKMGGALIRGILKANLAKPEKIVASDPDSARLQSLSQEAGIRAASDNSSAVRAADLIFLAVKPDLVPPVLKEMGDQLKEPQVLVSIAAGVPLSRILPLVSLPASHVIRVMPNTPCQVGQGAIGMAVSAETDPQAKQLVRELLSSVGLVVELEEGLLDAVTGLSGSGPAYVFVMIEALADGGVAVGLPRDIALKLATQTILGAATMVMETGRHPEELKDAVASPGGTTIAGLQVLEQGAFRASLVAAVKAAAQRAKELSGQPDDEESR